MRTGVVEVLGQEAGVRVFVVHSEERERYERGMREVSMERACQELEALKMRVEKGELKEPEKIGVAPATQLRRHHGHGYIAWELGQGKFHFFEHPVNGAREKVLEGKYVIQIEEQNLSPVEAVTTYQELKEVGRGFSHLKDPLELRPVYHQSDGRVQAHVFVAALALFLDRALEKTCERRAAACPHPWPGRHWR